MGTCWQRILLTVNAASDAQAQAAYRIFDRHGGAEVRAYGVGAAGAERTTLGGTAPRAGEAETTITSGELRDERGRDRPLR